MNDLIKALGDRVVGVISGLDRIVFHGMVQPLMYAEGAMNFFSSRGILYKDAQDWVIEQTQRLVAAVEAFARREGAGSIEYLDSSRIRKEELARTRQADKGIDTGLVGVFSCLEAAGSYRLVAAAGAPRLRWYQTRCKHLYTYLDHRDFGFMSVRMQTWLPYRIQIAMNGREWLARQLAAAGIGFEKHRNKILAVDDFEQAAQLMRDQVRTAWVELLDGFVPMAFPTWRETLGEGLDYRWSVWQSEWATDVLLRSAADTAAVIDPMIHHAFAGGHPDRLLRYFGREKGRNGRLRRSDLLSTGILAIDEGCRIRHWHGRNSAKLYNERNVVRIETTINDPSVLKTYRRKQGAPPEAPKQRLDIRKSVADIPHRARASQEINDRFAQHLATTEITTPFGEQLAEVTSATRRGKRRARALDPTGKDLLVLRAVADPRYAISGMSNRDLRLALAEHPGLLGKTDRQRSRWVTRALRLLRDHGVLRKLPNTRRYQLTSAGREITTGLAAFLTASIQSLMKAAA